MHVVDSSSLWQFHCKFFYLHYDYFFSWRASRFREITEFPSPHTFVVSSPSSSSSSCISRSCLMNVKGSSLLFSSWELSAAVLCPDGPRSFTASTHYCDQVSEHILSSFICISFAVWVSCAWSRASYLTRSPLFSSPILFPCPSPMFRSPSSFPRTTYAVRLSVSWWPSVSLITFNYSEEFCDINCIFSLLFGLTRMSPYETHMGGWGFVRLHFTKCSHASVTLTSTHCSGSGFIVR